MLTSFNILREIEAEYDAKLQKGDLDQLRRIFATLYGYKHPGAPPPEKNIGRITEK